jgi:hypothetical protein
MSILRKFWEGWKRIGGFIGDVLARLILTLFYFTLVLPFGVLMRILRDPLSLRQRGTPAWRPSDPDEPSIDAARRLS